MSKSFLQPTQEPDLATGAQNAKTYFTDNFADTSFVIISAMPGNTYQCFTVDNENEKYYFSIP